MKKLLFLVFATTFFVALHAQEDSTLKQYTGKYKFPEGSPVTEVTIHIEKGVLMAVSPMGSSEFRKTTQVDVFDIVAYGGTATFKRTDGKVTGVQMLVQDMVLDGTKSEDGMERIFIISSGIRFR